MYDDIFAYCKNVKHIVGMMNATIKIHLVVTKEQTILLFVVLQLLVVEEVVPDDADGPSIILPLVLLLRLFLLLLTNLSFDGVPGSVVVVCDCECKLDEIPFDEYPSSSSSLLLS